jgi:sugar lactone lactonase YvrE
MSDTTVFISGLHFAEGPRWHDGALYFSDFYAHSVYRADDNGDLTQLATIDQQPSGLGWLPNGDLLVVSMIDRSVVRVREGHDPEPYADLRSATTFLANDMLVDPAGRAYVGNFGFDLHTYINTHGIEALMTGGATATTLALVNADGSVEVAAEEMMFPNGMALTADRSTLIVAETLALRLTAFDLDADGRLHNRRVWADLSSELAAPDGICIDANDRVWVANALGGDGPGLDTTDLLRRCGRRDRWRHAVLLHRPRQRRHARCVGTERLYRNRSNLSQPSPS